MALKVLVACEFSGVVRNAFRNCGHDAWSCDLLAAEDASPFHIQEEILKTLATARNWDLMIAHPPCTHLAVSGARWFYEKEKEQKEAIYFIEALWRADIPRICIENPVGILPTRSCLGKAAQYIQPWQFGHGEVKRTGLWLKGLPPLKATDIVNGREGRIHEMPPSKDRWKERSRTYTGIAKAMAEQWGILEGEPGLVWEEDFIVVKP